MSLLVRVWGAYATYGGAYGQWRQLDYDVMKVVDALKGDPINGWVTVYGRQLMRRDINEASRHLAFEHIGEWAAAQLASVECQIALVPIPSSKCIDSSRDFTAKRIAEAIRQHAGRADIRVTPVLQQLRPLLSSHREGGTRDPATLLANLDWNDDVEQPTEADTVVLIDDVKTSGGHIRAAAAMVRDHGFECERALCAALATQVQVPEPLNVPDEDMEAPAPEYRE